MSATCKCNLHSTALTNRSLNRLMLRNLVKVSDNFGHNVMADEAFGNEYVARHAAALLGEDISPHSFGMC